VTVGFRLWCSSNFVRIGSTSQHLFVTYLLNELLTNSSTHTKQLFDDPEIFDLLRLGIQERIEKSQTASAGSSLYD
jgi:hypothetical protein